MAFRTSSKSRLSKLASVGAKVVGQSIAGVLTARPQLQTRIEQAKAIAEALAELKGASMKFGQILSIQGESFLPPEVTEILSKLQNSAPAFSGEEMKEFARNELGDRMDEMDFDLEPLAAASIGQVHRIKLKTGQMGVIKIQYPGIDKAIESEVLILKRVLGAISKVYVGELAVDMLVDEVKALLLQEVDYEKEFSYLGEFYEFVKDQPNLVIPKPFARYSTKKVISMTQENGLGIKTLMNRNPSQEIRNQFGDLIFDLYMKEVYSYRLVQTDPNFGNYLFRLEPNPAVVLLDFGACKRYSAEMIEDYKLFVKSIMSKDQKLFFEIADRMKFLSPEEGAVTKDLFWTMCKMTVEPVEVVGPFDFGNSDLPKRLNSIAIQFLKSVRKTSPPTDVIFLNRKIGGIYNLLRVLGVKRDYRELVAPYLEKA